MFYKETVKAMDKSSKSSMAMAAAIVFAIVVIVGLCNFLYNRFGVSYVSYIAYLLCLIIGVYVYRKKIREYSYSLIDDELIFEQIVGTRVKPIISVKLSKVKYFCPLADEKSEEIKWDQNYKLLFNRKSSNAYAMTLKQGKRNIRIVFEPSEKMIELIRERRK